MIDWNWTVNICGRKLERSAGHSHLYFSTNFAALKCRFGDIPLAITNHGLYSQNASEWLFDLYLKTVGRWTFNQADVVFCYTDEDMRRIREFAVTADIEVVPNGIDIKQFTPRRTQERRDRSRRLCRALRRPTRRGKRPSDAIDAAQQIRQDHPDVKLYVCGERPLRSELETADKDGVEFLGQIPYTDIPAVYRCADVLVLPSRAEGVPRTVLEAMATGVPVVCSALEPMMPVVEGIGYTVPVGDIDGFATAIERLVTDNETYERLAMSGQVRIEDQFEWETTVEQTTATLQRLVESNST